MKNNSFFLLALLALTACQGTTDQTKNAPDSVATVAAVGQPEGSPNNFYCIPGVQAGNVKANSSEASLRAMLGAENVVRDSVYIGEGYYEKGTTLFKGTPEEAQILWKDTVNYANPTSLMIRSAKGEPSKWLVDNGVVMGVTLKEVEKINGKPFKISGFGWDYGGFATDWQRGKLAGKKEAQNLVLRFYYNIEDDKLGAIADKVLGEGPFLSSNPAMQQLNPKVVEITIGFD
ncbi:hypothetical protein [Runella slithyformis]|uniref:Uncharacterized protein n=1 Tax=Runella slithyformis (strain ATCC 29530 / DSM 19594 / LMG 11500 / NCIMB 11436 / LSU 4) TaxID=761193 RepID=A0A7U4E5B5_RUNSL|nr:hypothetical protein [Runella slithyformis]AEI48401.1 hypothetical protein Runsl_1983 [Runella slithyformis DSM 19594]